LAKIRLKEREKKILLAHQLCASVPVVEMAKRLQISTHTIHYTLAKYRELGVLRRGAIINFRKLGLELYSVYFALSSKGVAYRAKMLKSLSAYPQVAWLGELGGNFHYGVSFYARTPSEAVHFMGELSRLTGEGASKKEISLIHQLHFFSKNYLAADIKMNREMISLEESLAQETIDLKDQTLMYSLFQKKLDSHQRIAQATGLPRATVQYRLNRLEERGIIDRHVYYISAYRLGYLVYRLLIRIRGLRSNASQLLKSFALAEPNVVSLSECLGPWEYEIGVEVGSAPEVVRLVERLQLKHGAMIEDIEILPVFSQTTSSRAFFPKWKIAV